MFIQSVVPREVIRFYKSRSTYTTLCSLVVFSASYAFAQAEKVSFFSGSSNSSRFERTLIEPVDKASTLNEEGVALVFKGRVQEGLEKIEEALAIQPNNTAYLYNLAGIYLSENELSKAEKAMSKALAIQPQDLQFLCRHGEILMRDGVYKKAAATFEKILKMEPSHVNSLIRLGAVYGTLEQWEKAEVALRKARELQGDDAGILANLGNVLIARTKFKESLPVLRRAQNIRATPHTAISLGIAYEALGKKRKALHYYRFAQSLRKNEKGEILKASFSNHGRSADSYSSAKQIDDLEKYIQELSEEIPD